MIQHVIRHPAGRFLRCNCGKEPRHVHLRGRTSDEGAVLLAGPHERDQLECACGKATRRHASLALAEQEWGANFAQLDLPLRQARRYAA